jgi:hypothetical protein
VALVRERTLPNELPLIFGEVSANFSDWGRSMASAEDLLRP